MPPIYHHCLVCTPDPPQSRLKWCLYSYKYCESVRLSYSQTQRTKQAEPGLEHLRRVGYHRDTIMKSTPRPFHPPTEILSAGNIDIRGAR